MSFSPDTARRRSPSQQNHLQFRNATLVFARVARRFLLDRQRWLFARRGVHAERRSRRRRRHSSTRRHALAVVPIRHIRRAARPVFLERSWPVVRIRPESWPRRSHGRRRSGRRVGVHDNGTCNLRKMKLLVGLIFRPTLVSTFLSRRFHRADGILRVAGDAKLNDAGLARYSGRKILRRADRRMIDVRDEHSAA